MSFLPQSIFFSLGIGQHPNSTVVYIDRNATFLCGIVNNAILYWTVNGSLTHQLPTNDIVDITTANGIMLTITARVQYNNTVVQCFAEERGVGDGFEESDNVTLAIQGTFCVYLKIMMRTGTTVRLEI